MEILLQVLCNSLLIFARVQRSRRQGHRTAVIKTSEAAFVSKIVTDPKTNQEVDWEKNIHVKRNTGLSEILHPEYSSEDVLRFLVQH